MIRRLLPDRVSASDASTRRVGRLGEAAAAEHVRALGLRVLKANVRSRIGEADLVCLTEDRATLVIVEVKSRVAHAAAGERRPEAQITAAKKRKLRAVARSIEKKFATRLGTTRLRIDVAAVRFEPGPKPLGKNSPSDPEIRYYERAVGDA